MAFDRSIPVLVVDDYDRMIRILRDLLRQVGFEDIDDAANGSAALTKMRAKKYGPASSLYSLVFLTDFLQTTALVPDAAISPDGRRGSGGGR
jgi:two-component system, chemotaxis family, chemotaxis protein CheY